MKRLLVAGIVAVFFFHFFDAFSQNIDNYPVEFAKQLQEAESAEQEMNAAMVSAAYGKAVEIQKKLRFNYPQLPELYYKYGSMLIYSGSYAKAVDVLTEAIQINNKRSQPDKLFEARTYMQFGILHFFQEQWDDALYYYEKAKAGATELKDELGISIAENNIANIYQKKGEFQKAIEGYERCLELQENLQDSATIANSFFNLGTCYEELNQPKKARSYLEKALEISKAINDVEIISLSMIHIGKNAIEGNNLVEAEKFLSDAETIIHQSGYQQVLSELYQVKSELYEKQGNHKAALEIFKQNHALLDSIADEKLHLRTKELTIQLQTEEKERQIELQQVKISNRNRIIVISTIFLILALLFSFLFYQMWRQRQRQNKELVRLNRTKDKLFSIISHDLRSPLIAQKTAIDTLSQNFEALKKDDMLSFFQILQDNSVNQLAVIENLTNWAKSQTNKFNYSPQTFELSSLVNDEMKLYAVAASNKNITFDVDVPKSCLVFADRQMIGIVIRNLINNAVKFSHEGQTISIKCVCENQRSIISVVDQGVGMTTEQISKLNIPGSQAEVRFGTKGEKGTGLGLILCRELLEKNKSKLHIVSGKEGGTSISFALDKPKNS